MQSKHLFSTFENLKVGGGGLLQEFLRTACGVEGPIAYGYEGSTEVATLPDNGKSNLRQCPLIIMLFLNSIASVDC